jgi:hypothetical protein
VRAPKKRGGKAIAAGAVATLALGAGLLMTFGRTLASEEAPPPHVTPAAAQAPNRAARAVEIATPVDMGNSPAWADPQPTPTPFVPAEPGTAGAIPVATSAPEIPPFQAPNRGTVAASNANKQTGQGRWQAQGSTQAPAAQPAPMPAPPKKSEPAVVLPDDR